MNEAERFLAEKMKMAETPTCVPSPEKGSVRDGQVQPSASAGIGAPTPSPKRDATGKAWSVGLAVFAVLMTMFWMAVFKGGCR